MEQAQDQPQQQHATIPTGLGVQSGGIPWAQPWNACQSPYAAAIVGGNRLRARALERPHAMVAHRYASHRRRRQGAPPRPSKRFFVENSGANTSNDFLVRLLI